MKRDMDVQSFSGYSAFSYSQSFRGQDIASLLSLEMAKRQSFQEGYEKGVEKGVEAVSKSLMATVRKQLDSYLAINTRIVDYIKDSIENNFESNQMRFIEARADLSLFLSAQIKILFIVEGEIENETWIASLLSDLSVSVFEEVEIFPELLFINQRSKELDRTAIEASYPSVRIIKDA